MPHIYHERDPARLSRELLSTPTVDGQFPHADRIQEAFGAHDVTSMRAGVGKQASGLAKSVGAEAVAGKNRAVFDQAPSLHTAAHEAAHIVQQRQGRTSAEGTSTLEAEADRVADHVVSGQSAAPLLGDLGSEAVAESAAGVQFKKRKAHVANPVSVPANIDPETAPRAQYKHGKGPGDGAEGIAFTGETLNDVDNEGKSSNAANPNFEADALYFEKNLGNAAAGQANGVAAEMCAKVDEYMQVRGGALKESVTTLEDGMDKNYSLLGTTSKTVAGAVGKQVDDIKAVISSGNIRERMTMVDMFTRNVLSPDIAGASQKEAAKWAKDAGLHYKKVNQAISKYNERNSTADPNARAASKALLPEKGEVAQHQGTARIENRDRADQLSQRQVGANRKVDGGGPGLSSREEKLAVRKVEKPAPVSVESGMAQLPEVQEFLAWAEGARTWYINEKNTWVEAQRKVSLPLKAGPSGTTQRLMNTAQILQVGPSVRARLACIGYLLPIRAHSLVEVMTGAADFGLPFRQGQLMYTQIAPYSNAQLRKFGKDNKFPHETSPDQPE